MDCVLVRLLRLSSHRPLTIPPLWDSVNRELPEQRKEADRFCAPSCTPKGSPRKFLNGHDTVFLRRSCFFLVAEHFERLDQAQASFAGQNRGLRELLGDRFKRTAILLRVVLDFLRSQSLGVCRLRDLLAIKH